MSTNEFYPFDETPENKGEDKNSEKNEFNDNFGLPEVPSTQSFFNEDDEPSSASTIETNDSFSEDYSFNTSGADSNSTTNFGEETDYSQDSGSTSSGHEETYSSNGSGASKFIIFGLLALVLLALGWGVYYFYFKTTLTEEEQVVQTIDTPVQTPVKEEISPADNNSSTQNETIPVVDQQEEVKEPEVIVPVENTSSNGQGVNQYVGKRTGTFYIIVSSFIDEDLAKDLAAKLNKESFDTYILAPTGKKKYYRLGIEQSVDFQEANDRLTADLKDKLGNDLWVLKY